MIGGLYVSLKMEVHYLLFIYLFIYPFIPKANAGVALGKFWLSLVGFQVGPRLTDIIAKHCKMFPLQAHGHGNLDENPPMSP